MIPVTTAWQAPLEAGAVLLALWFGVQLVSKRLATWQRAPWWGWSWLASLAELLAAVAALLGGLSLGIWLPGDVGLVAPDWAGLLGWLPGYVAGMALWLALLCGAAWRRATPQDGPVRLAPQVARLLRDETLLAALRGALAPLLGLYWGSWAAAAVRLAVGWWFPAAKQARLSAADRRELLVHRALDLVATVVIIMAGSVWVALGARIIVYAAGMLARALVLRVATRNDADKRA